MTTNELKVILSIYILVVCFGYMQREDFMEEVNNEYASKCVDGVIEVHGGIVICKDGENTTIIGELK